MKSLKLFLLLGAGILLFFVVQAWADVPKLINFQGRLTDGSGTPVKDSTYAVLFTIYDDATGGTNLWSETQSVATKAGTFNVNLGSSTALPDTIFDDTTRYLAMKVGTDPEMTPRQRIVSMAYGYRVRTVDGATGGTISGDVDIQSDLTVSGNVGIGTTNPQVKLQVDSGIVSFTHQSAVYVDNITSFNVPHAVLTKVPYSSESYDRQNEYDPSTNYRFTASKAGDYLVCASLAAPSSFGFLLLIFKNGVIEKGFVGGGYLYASGCRITHLEANDYIEIFIYQGSGITKTFSPDIYWDWLTINKIN